MRIINGKGEMPMKYEVQLVCTPAYTSVELHVKAPGSSKYVFHDNHTVMGKDSDFTAKTALIGAEKKWGLELLEFNLNTAQN
jgi:hypothetical protein